MTDSPPPSANVPEVDPDSAYAFAPVPTRKARHDGWTPLRQRQFIAALAAMGVVDRAAKAVGMSGASAYNLRKRPGAEGFAAAWDAALQEGRDRAFDVAMDRATRGYLTPRYYAGRFVGTTHRLDNRMILAALSPPAPPPRQRDK